MLKAGREAIDLDTSCVALSDRGEVIMEECVYFAQLRSKSGALVHTGDEQEVSRRSNGVDSEPSHLRRP